MTQDRKTIDLPCVWILVGPTAAGKTDVAQYLAERKNAIILSADAMLVYRGINIGTAKPPTAYRECIPYFGVDIAELGEACNVASYLAEARRAVLFSRQHNRPIIIVGGSGLYVKCLLAGLDPSVKPLPEIRRHWEQIFSEQGIGPLQVALRKTAPQLFEAIADPLNSRRLIRALEKAACGETHSDTSWEKAKMACKIVGISLPRESLMARIQQRIEQFYRGGLLDEVRLLRTSGLGNAPTALQAIGYREALDHLEGLISLDEAIRRTTIRTRQLAKRQMTWFKHQLKVEWVIPAPRQSIQDIAQNVDALWQIQGPVTLHQSLYE